jgi:hypothetical protein
MMNNSPTLVLRRCYGEQGTNGVLTYEGRHVCYTIELPDRNNSRRISCIPEGRYQLKKITYPRHGEQIGLPFVPGRDGILIHAANDAKRDLLGCIAPVTQLTGEGTGVQSQRALSELKALVYALWEMGEDVFLLISNQRNK